MIATRKLLTCTLAGLVLSTGLALPAFAQKIGAPTPPAATATTGDVDFGDDSGQWPKDTECDDSRFTGTGMATEMDDSAIRKDATDCSAAFAKGTITLKDTGTAPADIAIATPIDAINFGDDTSEWNKDGECDDPRFQGTGSASELVDADLMKDATDCKAAYEKGTITLKDTGTTTTTDTPVAINNTDIDFGDDSSEWSKDGECDDSRFDGTGMASEMDDSAISKDATDCSAAFAKGTITLKDTGTTTPVANADVDFGDDSSQWSKDGECDDPRFTGTGSASQLLDEDKLHDATDCKAAFTAGTITLKTDGTDGGDVPVVATGDIVFGDDAGEYNNDQECDDPRFEGTGVASEPVIENRMHDATDCQAAVTAGTATMKAGETNEAAAFDYGTDNSKYANDGECDDKRFVGTGMDKKLLEEDVSNDATDCRTMVESGALSIIPVYDPAYLAGAPYDSKGINFGDNTSEYANDDQCDDPRFQGPGTASTLLDGDLRHDRDDCKKAYEAGTVILID
ncbi:MAG: hypothetical protein JWQ65_31 [Devosia sp.]|nr:hypothetical protein [Devosia sp.]